MKSPTDFLEFVIEFIVFIPITYYLVDAASNISSQGGVLAVAILSVADILDIAAFVRSIRKFSNEH